MLGATCWCAGAQGEELWERNICQALRINDVGSVVRCRSAMFSSAMQPRFGHPGCLGVALDLSSHFFLPDHIYDVGTKLTASLAAPTNVSSMRWHPFPLRG